MAGFAHRTQETVLCLDVGGKTQSGLLVPAGCDSSDMFRLVLPSPALLLARRVAACTESRRNLYIHGPNMGRGFFTAVIAHVKAGCGAAMHPETAAALFGDAAVVTAEGVTPAQTCPKGHVALLTGDVNVTLWRHLCRMAGLGSPARIAVAARDHGGYPGDAVRAGRMARWREWLHKGKAHGADPKTLVFASAPPELTRLAAIQSVTGGPVADSASAALLGLLSIEAVAERSHKRGVLLVYAGNTHLTGFLVYRERVFGVYEQHTRLVDGERIRRDLSEFRLGWLPTEEVERRGGHGSVFLDLPPEAEGFASTYITGPARHLLEGHGRMAAPCDDAALTGCFGLLYGIGLSPGAVCAERPCPALS